MPTKEEALDKIRFLVERFDEQREFYANADYNETQARRDFIDPFWKALGWDVDNEAGNAQSYREVIHEDRLKVGGATKAPDYSFRLPGGKRLFFLEAKKPSVTVKDDAEAAYQIRRYGWSAKMAVSVITDFEEFAIYDCYQKPKSTDKASVARVKYLTYREYIAEFDFLWDTFSKERVLKGSFDKYILSDKGKKGTTTVDDDFLATLDNWRVVLALNIALRNEINEDELNFVVQNTLDRIVFLRIAEDRNVERYGDLQNTIKNGDYYRNLLRLFHIAEQKYDSGLFEFDTDKISTKISIDDNVIKNIVFELYYPKCPYEFSVLSVEILGSAYERFLGKRIVLSQSGRRARVEEKPEVRKSGGVYYTPQYIVDYIVENTVGQLVENKTPQEVSKITIVDPACGSGGFLIGAYSYLLNWHKDYYVQHYKPSKGQKHHPLTPDGELTTVEKKRILLNSIYGVDLDGIAVEITKLSLLLKCMEGETCASIETHRKLFHDRVLPDLDDNIRSGNSLIDLDYYDNEFDFGEERKIKPFSWQKAFPQVFKQGGFDCVIGNPPYVNAKMLVKFFNKERQYLTKTYKFLYQKWDLYVAFIEKSLSLLKRNGLNSMIVPYPLINQVYGKALRTHIVENHKLVSILDLSNIKVFKQTVVTNIVYCIEKFSTTDKVNIRKIKDKVAFESHKVRKQRFLRKNDENNHWNITPNISIKLDKSKFHTLGDICFISKGMVLNADEKTAEGEFVKKDLINTRQTKKHSKKYIEAKNIDRYKINNIRYLEWKTSRVPGKISRPTFIELYENPKLLINKLGQMKATFDDANIYCDQTIRIAVLWENLKSVQNHSINNSVKRYSNKSRNELEAISKAYNEKFLLGILNSKTCYYFLDTIRGINNIDINPEYLKRIPVPKIDFTNQSQKKNHDEIIKRVDQILQLNKDLQAATLPNQKKQIKSRIEYNEDKINEMVYELYGLTEDEIATIETGTEVAQK